jgi:hypothetical protein
MATGADRGERVTVRDAILARPDAVQIVIKAKITKSSIDDDSPDYDRYGIEALDWWEQVVKDWRVADPDADESSIADRVIQRLRGQDVWGRILREGAN